MSHYAIKAIPYSRFCMTDSIDQSCCCSLCNIPLDSQFVARKRHFADLNASRKFLSISYPSVHKDDNDNQCDQMLQ